MYILNMKHQCTYPKPPLGPRQGEVDPVEDRMVPVGEGEVADGGRRIGDHAATTAELCGIPGESRLPGEGHRSGDATGPQRRG